ncbi:MAG: hypothetical protein HC849_23270 [Oscillatoriales cyanobacterium RU_3_3]|nr:hypothetical protein [Oscillatoriales cyanobacterium RU_3_3]
MSVFLAGDRPQNTFLATQSRARSQLTQLDRSPRDIYRDVQYPIRPIASIPSTKR